MLNFSSDLNGFGFCERQNEKLRQILNLKLSELEKDAYKLANRKFRLNSSEDICQILYRELRLPINGKKDDPETKYTCSRNQRIGLRNAVRPASSKEILLKLKNYHELPSVIIEWRKINAAIGNTVIPLSRACKEHSSLKMKRIYPTSNMFTVTGRMTMQEPSIQMVPRDFNVNISASIFENVKENMFPKDNKLSHDSLMSSFTELLTNSEGIVILFQFLNKIFGINIT